jgi:hypothetical protein
LQRLRQNASNSVAHLGWDAIHDSFIHTLTGLVNQHGKSLIQTSAPNAALAINQTSA